MAAAVVLITLLVGIALTVGLYLLIDAETSNPRIVDRETATREAMERGGRRSGAADDPAGEPGDTDDERYGWLDETGDDDRLDGRR